MKLEIRLKQLAQTLPPKQRTLDLHDEDPWAQLPTADRQACRAAVAALLCQVTLTPPEDEKHE